MPEKKLSQMREELYENTYTKEQLTKKEYNQLIEYYQTYKKTLQNKLNLCEEKIEEHYQKENTNDQILEKILDIPEQLNLEEQIADDKLRIPQTMQLKINTTYIEENRKQAIESTIRYYKLLRYELINAIDVCDAKITYLSDENIPLGKNYVYSKRWNKKNWKENKKTIK